MHCEVEEILDVLEGRGDERVAAHLESCGRCKATLEELRWLTRALTDRMSWNRKKPSSDRLEELTSLASAIANPETPIGKVYDDCRRSSELRDDDPALALEIATRARNDVLALFGRYEDEAVRGALGLAQKERANALRVLGRYTEALSATRGARSVVQQGAAADFDLAVLDYVDATIYREIGQLEDALTALDRCTPVFEEYGEKRRAVHAMVVRGAILFSAGRLREARELYRELLANVQDLDDTATEARIWTNLAGISNALGELDEASVALVHARAGWERLGARVEKLRADWSLANLLGRRGDFTGSEARLRVVVDEFSSMEMTEDVTLAGLDLAEVLIIQEKFDEAHRVLERAASEIALRPTPTRRKLLASMQELITLKPTDVLSVQMIRRDFSSVMPAAGPAVVVTQPAPPIN